MKRLLTPNLFRYEDPAHILKRRLVQLGDSDISISVQQQLIDLSNSLERDVREKKDVLVGELILECICQLPMKSGIYAVLVGLLSLKFPNFGSSLVDRCSRVFQSYINDNQTFKMRLILRFLCELTNCGVLDSDSLVSLFDVFINIINDEETLQIRNDFYLGFIIKSLPYVGNTLEIKQSQWLQNTCDTIEDYFKSRSTVGSNSSTLIWLNDDPQEDDKLLFQWKSTIALKDNNWKSDTIQLLQPYSLFIDQLSSLKANKMKCANLVDRQIAGAPILRIPKHTKLSKYANSSTIFRLFDEKLSEKNFPIGTRCILEDLIDELFHFFSGSVDQFLKRLRVLPVSFNVDPFILEYIIGCMLKLPNSYNITLSYSSILINILKKNVKLAPMYFKGVDLLFQNIDTMDTECFSRVVYWFSLHLSNFDFKWEWKQWEYALKEGDESLRVRFIRATLSQCVKLSYWQRVEKNLDPKTFVDYMPPAPKVKYQYSETTSVVSEDQVKLGTEILSKIKGKDLNLGTWLKSNEPFMSLSTELQIDIFIQTLLFAGSASISHFYVYSARYTGFIKSLIDNNDNLQLQVLNSLGNVWHQSEQHQSICTDRFMSLEIVNNITIITWILQEESSSLLSFQVWGILHSTISKTIARTQLLANECEDQSRKSNRNPQDEYASQVAVKSKELFTAQDRQQKDMFINIFQRFSMTLDSFLSTHQGNVDQNEWYKEVSGQMLALGRRYREQIEPVLGTLRLAVFTEDIDSRIIELFNKFASLNIE